MLMIVRCAMPQRVQRRSRGGDHAGLSHRHYGLLRHPILLGGMHYLGDSGIVAAAIVPAAQIVEQLMRDAAHAARAFGQRVVDVDAHNDSVSVV